MTNTEIEKYIHEQVMGLNARHLSHFWQMPEGDTVFKCSRCFQRRGLENSDQCGRPCREYKPGKAGCRTVIIAQTRCER